MQINFYTLFDKKAVVFSSPFASANDVFATRAVTLIANDLSHSVGQFPADYGLFKIGTFDDADGSFNAHAPQFITEVISLVYKKSVELPLAPVQEK